MSLDFLVLDEAHQEFWKEYHKEIEELGYNLVHGTIKMDRSLEISALIKGEEFPPETVQTQIRTMLPETYLFKNNKIPVRIIFSSYAHLH